MVIVSALKCVICLYVRSIAGSIKAVSALFTIAEITLCKLAVSGDVCITLGQTCPYPKRGSVSLFLTLRRLQISPNLFFVLTARWPVRLAVVFYMAGLP